jgi:hypothetical protein
MNAAPALWTQGAPAAAAEPPYTLVNDLLAGNFRVMATLPRPAALVFFRDVTTLPTLLAILGGQTASMAPLLPRVVAELVGPRAKSMWVSTFHSACVRILRAESSRLGISSS